MTYQKFKGYARIYKNFTKYWANSGSSKRKDPVLNVVTLFSGMGAPEIALDKLGVKYRIVLASDIDPEAEAVYKQLHGKNLLKEMIHLFRMFMMF